MVQILFSTLILIVSVLARADVEHKLFRKVAVFPISDSQVSSAEDAWWQMREVLTKDKKFLIAAKRFMINRGVYQPRKALKPADAIILGRLLDAEALVVAYLEDRSLRVKVYEAENGYVLWESEAQFHPAVPIKDQLVKVGTKMMDDFLAAVPYQGFTVKDEATDRVVIDSDGQKRVRVFSGGDDSLQKGDLVQWVSIQSGSGEPAFRNPQVKVLADGLVEEKQGDYVLVTVKNALDFSVFEENRLVRFPKEMAKASDLYAREKAANAWEGQYFKNQLKPVNEFFYETQASATSMATFFSILAFVLMAF